MVHRLPAAGLSVLLISHNLEDVISVADRAVTLRQGRKVRELPATRENYERIVSLIVAGGFGQRFQSGVDGALEIQTGPAS
jgi:ABC-type sugar transport system ATPase subunit